MKGQSLQLVTPTAVGGRHHLPRKICGQSDPLPSTLRETPTNFRSLRLNRKSQQISPIITFTKSTTGLPTIDRRTAYSLRYS